MRPANLLLHLRLLVGRSQERENIILGCMNAGFELALKPQSGSGAESSSSKEPAVH